MIEKESLIYFRLLKSMFFELLCRVQNPDALNKATELFRLIPSSYFSNSSNITKYVFVFFSKIFPLIN